MQNQPPTNTKPSISKTTLVTVSVVADAIDIIFLAGIAPGPWSLLIDAPVTAMHFAYAGPKAAVVLAEYVPFAGFLPIYTIAALLYPAPLRRAEPGDAVMTAAPRDRSPVHSSGEPDDAPRS
jgi:hypothetical protein